MYDFEFGSRTAKGGFANEKAVCEKFNNWKNDEDAKLWLKIMGYDPDKIDYVKAIQIPTRIKKEDIKKFGFSEEDYEELIRFKKTDIQVNTAMNFFGKGDVKVSPRGSLYIGRITMQRKGGTPDPTKLQFKIKPCDLFKLESGGEQ